MMSAAKRQDAKRSAATHSAPALEAIPRNTAIERPPIAQDEVNVAADLLARVANSINHVVLGKETQVELVLLALLASGHVLLEDVPGTGKTTLAKALASTLGCSFSRIQFTPDVMPSDVVGYSVFDKKAGDFVMKPGGIMANLVLADEINRASAKTQSALLEAMGESQVTIDKKTFRLEKPFMVIATQNTIDSQGTYPLPEAQLDRFALRISLGYPDLDREVDFSMARSGSAGRSSADQLAPVVSKVQVIQLQDLTTRVFVHPLIVDYAVQIVAATRTMSELELGASPRASIVLTDLARANALMRGRTYVLPDDVKFLAPHVLAHRIVLTQDARGEGLSAQDICTMACSQAKAPDLSPFKFRKGGSHGKRTKKKARKRTGER